MMKSYKTRREPPFFFSLFKLNRNLIWVDQNGNFLLGKKSGKINLPPQKNIPVPPLIVTRVLPLLSWRSGFFRRWTTYIELSSYSGINWSLQKATENLFVSIIGIVLSCCILFLYTNVYVLLVPALCNLWKRRFMNCCIITHNVLLTPWRTQPLKSI